jgi:hypothetical protein
MASIDHPFKIHVWDADGDRMEEELAAFGNQIVATRCWDAFLRYYAKRRLPDGIAIFDALHRRGTVSEAMLCAFDLLELDGEDLRGMPLGDRKKHLARLLGGRRLGIVPHRRGRRHDLPASLPHGPGRHRLKAADRTLQVGPVAGLAEGQEPG